MEVNADQLLGNALRDGIREGVKQRLSAGYGSPLEKIIDAAITSERDQLHAMMVSAIQACVGDAQFREDIRVSVRSVLARTLVQRFGGELEKQVNNLKSDPTTRARITLAIEDILKEKTA